MEDSYFDAGRYSNVALGTKPDLFPRLTPGHNRSRLFNLCA
jgi:hypothetical protein